MSENIKGLHATLEWEPYTHVDGHGPGGKSQGYRRQDGMGYAIPEGDGRWWVSWAHSMMGGRPGWHHHAFGSYASKEAAVIAFDKVYELERRAGNFDRCPKDFAKGPTV